MSAPFSPDGREFGLVGTIVGMIEQSASPVRRYALMPDSTKSNATS